MRVAAEEDYAGSQDVDLHEGFEAVALAHYQAVYTVAKHLTQHPSDAQDLVQDTYLRAYRFWHRFVPGTHVKAWLCTILRHVHITAYRKHSRHPGEREVATGAPVSADPLPAPVWSAPGDIEERLAYVVQDEVKQALEALPAAYRHVVLLADLGEYSYKDIAAIVGCPLGTVMSRLSRGRQLLRQHLETFARQAGYIKGRQMTSRSRLGQTASLFVPMETSQDRAAPRR
jgi:RNA polymerase sigma-70 factor, ECF subfamily